MSVEPLEPGDFAEAAEIDWFANCGLPDPDLGGYRLILDRETAIASLSSIEYENFQIDRQGDITEMLTLGHSNHGWNRHAEGISSQLKNVFERLDAAGLAAGFPQVFMDSARWDVTSYFQEKTFRRRIGIPIYFHAAFEVYRLGRLLCGYDGRHPGGRLVIH